MQIAAPLGDFWVPSTGMLESLYANLAMPIQEKNYWLETVATPPVESARDLPEDVDVAVVGGGFCGRSATRTLANGGQSEPRKARRSRRRQRRHRHLRRTEEHTAELQEQSNIG